MKKKKIKTLTPWRGLPAKFSYEDYAGFCYVIENLLTHQEYVGRKYFSQKRRKKIQGKKRSKRITSESDWKYYRSSSDDLKNDIDKYGLDAFTFDIISLHKTRAAVNYAETRELFIRDVLNERFPGGAYRYYNHQILGRYYRGKI